MTHPNTLAVPSITVAEENSGQRIDNFLFTRLKGLPKSRIYRALRGGEFRVNKKRVSADYRVQAGDLIRVPPLRVATPSATSTRPANSVLQQLADAILYEDKDLFIINKPSGVASHGGSGIQFGVIETFRHLYPKLKFLELVHRLDRDTSGCLMLAKKPSILKALQQQLVNGTIEKTYLALVQNPWPGGKQRVKQPLLKQGLRSGERIVRVHAEGKPAETCFQPLKKFPQWTLVEAKPQTGRTHQIRVHAAYLGHPIVGDDKYGNRIERPIIPIRHLLLHAASLRFQLPGEHPIAVCACLDPHFQEVLRQLTILE